MANTVLAKMAVQIAANTADFNNKLAVSDKKLSGFQKTAGLATKAFVALGAAISAGAIAREIFNIGVKAEQTAIAFNTFLGSATKGAALLKELTDFSVVTPFSPDQVNEAAKSLLSFGVEANKIIPTLKFLGDVSSGTGKDLKELAIIFGQIRSTGRLMGQDLLQLINAGFNPLQVISQQTGKSVAELKKEMEKGLISFEQVENAFKAATSEGGLFFNLMEKQSVSVGGKISTLSGNFTELGKTIFGLSSGPIPFLVDNLNKLVIKINELLKVTSFTEIAQAGLKNFSDKLKEVEGLLESDKQKGRELGNIFAADVVQAINEVNEELRGSEDFLGSIAAINGENSDIYKDQKNKIEILKEELALLKSIQQDLFKGLRESAESAVVAVEKLSRAGRSTIAPTTDVKGVSSSGIFGLVNPNFGDPIIDSLDAVNRKFFESINSLENWGESVRIQSQLLADSLVNVSGLIVGGIIDIANAFGEAAATGSKDFGNAILASLAGFAQQFGALLIATGIGEISFSKFKGPAMIAAGAGLIALGGAVRGAISKRPNLSGGGSVGGSARYSAPSSNFALAQNSTNQNLVPNFQIRGQDLWVIFNEYERNSKSTKFG